MKAALVANWTQPIPGREQKALAYGAEVTAYWTQRAKEGRCTEPEMFFSENGVGMWMVKGDREDLVALGASDEAQLLTMKGDLLLNDFSLVLYHTGDSAERFMATFSKAVEAIS